MKLAMDVQYDDPRAKAAGVVFRAWEETRPLAEYAIDIDRVQDYVPGEFYRREMPCLLQLIRWVLEKHPADQPPIETLIVDGFVYLGDSWGLGRHLLEQVRAEALTPTAVIGVAKTSFKGARPVEVLRGQSARPLFVTAEGTPANAAADGLRAMHGEHRIPTLLKRVDRLARGDP